MKNVLRICSAVMVVGWAMSVSQAAADVSDDPRVRSVVRTIANLSEIQKSSTNETERAHWDERLALARKELAHAKKVAQLDVEEEDFAAKRQTTEEERLLVLLATVESDMSQAEDRIEDRIQDIDKLKARRAELEVELAEAQEAKEQDTDANAELGALIRNIDAELLARVIARDSEELRIRLAKEAERIDTMRRSIDLSHRLTARLLLEKKEQTISAEHRVEEFTLLQASLEDKRADAVAAVDLAEERFVQLDREIEILTKRSKLDPKERRYRDMISEGKSDKKLLGVGIKYLKEQVEALTGELVLVAQGLALFEAEQEYSHHQYNAAMRRYRRRFVLPVALTVATILLYLLLSRVVFPRLFSRDDLFVARRAAGYLCAFIVIVIVAVCFLEDLKAIATMLGIVGAALVIALKELCAAFAGWFVIVASRKIKLGDRVEIDGHRGDVIDIQMLRVTLLEVNNWLGVDSPTGRLLMIPNSFIFSSHLLNYSHVHPYITGRIDITVTFESDPEVCREVLSGILEEETKDEYEKARHGSDLIEKKYGRSETVHKPEIHTVVADSGVLFKLFYISHYKRFVHMQDKISSRIAMEFAGRKDIAFAYPTERHIPTPEVGGERTHKMGME